VCYAAVDNITTNNSNREVNTKLNESCVAKKSFFIQGSNNNKIMSTVSLSSSLLLETPSGKNDNKTVDPAVHEKEKFNGKGDGVLRQATTVSTTSDETTVIQNHNAKKGPFGDDINAVPGKYRRLIPNEHPHWESPRPVRKGGPGGKYATSIVPPASSDFNNYQESSGEIDLKSPPSNKKRHRHLLEEHLVGLQKELRLAQQLADSRLKDLQKQKIELVRAQTEYSNLRTEASTLQASTKASENESIRLKQSLRDCQKSVRRLKNKLKSKESELNKRSRILSKTQTQLASVTQQRDDLIERININESSHTNAIQTLRDRMEAADRHYSEQLGYTKRELEDERSNSEKTKQNLIAAQAEIKTDKKNIERITKELNQERDAMQMAATREKGERKQWKRLWSDTVGKLHDENNSLWVQLQFMETALLEDELNRIKNIENGDSVTQNITSSSTNRQPSQKETRRARRLLQKHVEIQEDASQKASQVRVLEAQIVEARHEHAVMAGRLDFAETRVRELLSELRVQDHVERNGREDINMNESKPISDSNEKGHMRSNRFLKEKLTTIGSPQNQSSVAGLKLRTSNKSAHRPSQQQKFRQKKRGQYQGGRRLKATSKLEHRQTPQRHQSTTPSKSASPSIPSQTNKSSTSSYSGSTEGKVIIDESSTAHPYFPTKEQLQEIIRKLRNANKKYRAALANKESLLKSTLEERRRLLEYFHAAPSKSQKSIQRLTKRIAAIKREALEWHIHFRTELSLFGLFDEDKVSHHGINITPKEMADVIFRCAKLNSNKIEVKQDFDTLSTQDHILETRGIQLSGTYVKLTITLDNSKQNTHIYKISAYDPEACQEFKLDVTQENMMGLIEIDETNNENKHISLANALVQRLILSSVNGQRQLEIGSDRTVAVHGSNPEEEMARLMGTGTQQQELDKIKRDIKMGLEEEEGEVMDMDLIKRAVFTEVKQFDRANDGMQLLNVRLIDDLDEKGHIAVYCTDPQDNRVKFRLVLSRSDLNDLVIGGVDGQSRRGMCRLIIAQLKIKNGALSLIRERDEDESSDDKQQSQSHGENTNNHSEDYVTNLEEYTYDEYEEEENNMVDSTLFSGPVTLKSGRHVHIDIIQEENGISIDAFLEGPGDLEASLKLDGIPASFPSEDDNRDSFIKWTVDNLFISWNLQKNKPEPMLLISKLPSVIFRGSTVVHNEQCEICVFEVANYFDFDNNSQLEIGARRHESEDLRTFFGIREQEICLQGKSWSEIRDCSKIGIEASIALDSILSKLTFLEDEDGTSSLDLLPEYR
jgi:hypothetical protein